MLEVDKIECTGCAACQAVCPVSAISMQKESYGFVYPKVNTEICIDCGKCERVCHLTHNEEKHHSPIAYYALQLRDKDALMKVSSGGAFMAFARIVLHKGGIVYGAVQDEIYNVHHVRISDVSQLDHLCRSKYIQSDISDCFNQIKEDLKNKEVLFCGTPCQTNAICTFLGEKQERLLLCEIVCHGVPSPLAFEKYCEEMGEKKHAPITSIVFRDKTAGWNCNHYCIAFQNGKVLREYSNFNPFHGAYLQGLLYRKSCESCRYAKLERVSDLVLADYWKYEGALQEGNRGVSLVVVYSEKGSRLIEESKELAYVESTTKERALLSCRHLTNSPKINKRRGAALDLLEKKGYFRAYYRYAFLKIFLRKMMYILKKKKGT